ncbi:MAG: hypothetical protein JSU00_12560 [Acidobacteria bacterium]|nr:hypothetical protein [Acidobacteriota bacterium]
MQNTTTCRTAFGPTAGAQRATDMDDARIRRLILTDWKANLPAAVRAVEDLKVLQAALAAVD